MKTYKRVTVNVPEELVEIFDKRLGEAGYTSGSAYFLGLLVYDLWARREHVWTSKLMAQLPADRDASFKGLAAKFREGKKACKPGFFDHFMEGIVRDRQNLDLGLKDALPALLAALILFCSTASARVLETSAQITARYGKPVASRVEEFSPPLNRFYFQKSGIRISVLIKGGVSVSETFVRDDNEEMTAQEVSVLIGANLGPNSKFDGSADWVGEKCLAKYRNEMLIVDSVEWRKEMDRMTAAYEKRQREYDETHTLKGF